MEITNNEINAKKWDEIDSILMDIFNKIGMDLPSNFDKIVEFVYWNVYYTGDLDNWHEGDVVIGFRRWIEKQLS